MNYKNRMKEQQQKIEEIEELRVKIDELLGNSPFTLDEVLKTKAKRNIQDTVIIHSGEKTINSDDSVETKKVNNIVVGTAFDVEVVEENFVFTLKRIFEIKNFSLIVAIPIFIGGSISIVTSNESIVDYFKYLFKGLFSS